MRAFLVLVVVVSAAVADAAVVVEKSAVLQEKGKEARTEEKAVEAQAGQVGEGERQELGSRSAVPVAAPIYSYPYSTYYVPQVALAAPSQLARSDVKAAVPAVPYYPYAYTYPYYTYPYTPVVAAPPAPVHSPSPPVGASVYYGHWQ